jgi:hypothetical protein
VTREPAPCVSPVQSRISVAECRYSTLLDRQNIASYCNLWHRDEFWRIGGYAAIGVAEDWELQLKAKRAGYVGAHTDANIFEHRLHDRNKWSTDAARYGGLSGVAQVVNSYGV